MRATCPDCGAQGHIAAFFVEDDGKRLAALLADMQPELGRAVIGYLGLFKPHKTALRLARAVKLVQELVALVDAGSVCRDERSGMRRATTPSMWAYGIEQMLAQRAALTLPLDSHGYLRAVVYGLADKADAVAERTREEDARNGRHMRPEGPVGSGPVARHESKLENQLAFIRQMLNAGAYTPEQAEAEREKARQRHAGESPS